MNSEAEAETEEKDVSEYFGEENIIKIPFDEIYKDKFEEGVFDYDE